VYFYAYLHLKCQAKLKQDGVYITRNRYLVICRMDLSASQQLKIITDLFHVSYVYLRWAVRVNSKLKVQSL
jgi:hypothetical protein